MQRTSVPSSSPTTSEFMWRSISLSKYVCLFHNCPLLEPRLVSNFPWLKPRCSVWWSISLWDTIVGLSSERHNEVNRSECRKLLRSFGNVKTLRVGRAQRGTPLLCTIGIYRNYRSLHIPSLRFRHRWQTCASLYHQCLRSHPLPPDVVILVFT